MEQEIFDVLQMDQGKRIVMDTKYGERIVADIDWVSKDLGDVTYRLVSSNKPGFTVGRVYVINLDDLVGVAAA